MTQFEDFIKMNFKDRIPSRKFPETPKFSNWENFPIFARGFPIRLFESTYNDCKDEILKIGLRISPSNLLQLRSRNGKGSNVSNGF